MVCPRFLAGAGGHTLARWRGSGRRRAGALGWRMKPVAAYSHMIAHRAPGQSPAILMHGRRLVGLPKQGASRGVFTCVPYR